MVWWIGRGGGGSRFLTDRFGTLLQNFKIEKGMRENGYLKLSQSSFSTPQLHVSLTPFSVATCFSDSYQMLKQSLQPTGYLAIIVGRLNFEYQVS